MRLLVLVCILAVSVAYLRVQFAAARMLSLPQNRLSLLQPAPAAASRLGTGAITASADIISACNTTVVINCTASVQSRIKTIINSALSKSDLRLHSLKWKQGKLELLLCKCKSNNAEDSSPQLDQLEAFHKLLYAELEAVPQINAFLETCDVVISSPGLSDVLHTDRDFVTFQGFTVIVQTTEEFRKQGTTTTGTLVKRTAEEVVLSQKGKRVSIPRIIVSEVRLPPSLTEPGDMG